jgi:hypothetical protein
VTVAESTPLERHPAEGKGEQVFSGRRGVFTYYVTHEYETAPWGWVIVEGQTLIAGGDAVSHREALAQLGAELDLLDPPATTAPSRGGLVGLVGRLLWGE